MKKTTVATVRVKPKPSHRPPTGVQKPYVPAPQKKLVEPLKFLPQPVVDPAVIDRAFARFFGDRKGS